MVNCSRKMVSSTAARNVCSTGYHFAVDTSVNRMILSSFDTRSTSGNSWLVVNASAQNKCYGFWLINLLGCCGYITQLTTRQQPQHSSNNQIPRLATPFRKTKKLKSEFLIITCLLMSARSIDRLMHLLAMDPLDILLHNRDFSEKIHSAAVILTFIINTGYFRRKIMKHTSSSCLTNRILKMGIYHNWFEWQHTLAITELEINWRAFKIGSIRNFWNPSASNTAVTGKILYSSSIRNAPGLYWFTTADRAQNHPNVSCQLILQCYCDYIIFMTINMTTKSYNKSCITDPVVWKILHSFSVVLAWYHVHSGGGLMTYNDDIPTRLNPQHSIDNQQPILLTATRTQKNLVAEFVLLTCLLLFAGGR